MPKKKARPTKLKRVQPSKKTRSNSRQKHVLVGAVIALILVGLFVLYLGFNNIKRNSITTFEQCVAAGQRVMESYPRQCVINGKTYIEKIEDDENSFEILQIKKGTNDLDLEFERGNYIINSPTEWNNIFGETNIEPNVDFEEKTVIAVVMGQKPSGGYSVSIKQLEIGKDTIQFMVEEVIPGEKCFVTEALTNPYQIISIDKTQKEIRFVGNTVVNECLE